MRKLIFIKDCKDSCQKPIPPPETKDCLLLGFECATVASIFGFLISMIIFLVFIIVTSLKSKPTFDSLENGNYYINSIVKLTSDLFFPYAKTIFVVN